MGKLYLNADLTISKTRATKFRGFEKYIKAKNEVRKQMRADKTVLGDLGEESK